MSNDVGSAIAEEEHQQKQTRKEENRSRSIFDVPSNFFDSCCLLRLGSTSVSETPKISSVKTLYEEATSEGRDPTTNASVSRLSCNTCKAEFESLSDQRSHFKSDIHRFNVKLTVAGKGIVKEEEFDEMTSGSSFKDYDVSSISGSEDESEKRSLLHVDMHGGLRKNDKQKLFIRLQGGEGISLWKCLLFDEDENIMLDSDKSHAGDDSRCIREKQVIEKLKYLVHEPRDKTHLRIVLLASGGHFAGCVFDGNSVVAHKTYHRYVVRAKAGKKQSTKDASGRAAHSAGASLRRYNELALKKEIQELFAAWKPYFETSFGVFIYAPSDNRQLFFDGVKPHFSCKNRLVQNVPLSVRRPTLKEARRVYRLLTQVSTEAEENIATSKEDSAFCTGSSEDFASSTKNSVCDDLENTKATVSCSDVKRLDNLSIESKTDSEISTSTPLHEAAKSGNAEKVLELLEQGLDPCMRDERARTPYMLAADKEVRNTFRRFMAANLEKWDWDSAKVPSALTKEMEESQAAKQAEKDAKRKARAKELKKLRKEREKKAQTDGASSQSAPTPSQSNVPTSSVSKGRSQTSGAKISKEEELKRAQAAEREKRAAAAERRFALSASLSVQGLGVNVASASAQPKGVVTTDIQCSCCNSSLVGKVPFHRYNYKYCSTSCMHVHKEMLEDG